MGQNLVRSYRVERLEAIEEQDHDVHRPHPSRATIGPARTPNVTPAASRHPSTRATTGPPGSPASVLSLSGTRCPRPWLLRAEQEQWRPSAVISDVGAPGNCVIIGVGLVDSGEDQPGGEDPAHQPGP